MRDPGYRRTSGERNRMNRRMWRPRRIDKVASFPSEGYYEMRRDGWRKIDVREQGDREEENR